MPRISSSVHADALKRPQSLDFEFIVPLFYVIYGLFMNSSFFFALSWSLCVFICWVFTPCQVYLPMILWSLFLVSFLSLSPRSFVSYVQICFVFIFLTSFSCVFFTSCVCTASVWVRVSVCLPYSCTSICFASIWKSLNFVFYSLTNECQKLQLQNFFLNFSWVSSWWKSVT